ncbi:MAG: SDR family oxidoreductase [Actinobacteria bacterium]|nr:SDR family oxidoreductase [Actinomycetota bacterium]
MFSLQGRVAVVVGASGAIGRAFASAVGSAGASVALVGRREQPLREIAEELVATGVDAAPFPGDMLDLAALLAVRDAVSARWGSIDLLLNAAGGNVPAATLADGASPFELELDPYRKAQELNLIGPLAAIKVFGPALAVSESSDRAIVNVSSMAALQALSRVGGYGAAKAALESLTRSLAVELARGGTGIRVNAIAPGFFVGEQNRSLLLEADGSLTERGRRIIDKTPLGRFGDPLELASTVIWLCCPASKFVTGVVVPVDGGFSAYSGV